jgi:hypothetical protein
MPRFALLAVCAALLVAVGQVSGFDLRAAPHVIAGPASARRSALLSTTRRPAVVLTMIARGPKTGEVECSIRKAGFEPKKSPVLFGGGRAMSKDEEFKTWIGHIIPVVAVVPIFAPIFVPQYWPF